VEGALSLPALIACLIALGFEITAQIAVLGRPLPEPPAAGQALRRPAVLPLTIRPVP
jgi:hypothetical protein